MKNKKTILIVDNDESTALHESKILKQYDYEVEIACNSRQAVEAVENNQHINLILMAVELGSQPNGTETAQKILAKHNLPIVFKSSHNEKDIILKNEKITPYGYITNDADTTVLITSITLAFKLFESNKKIKGNENRFLSLFHNMREGVALNSIVFSADNKPVNYKIIEINSQFEKILNMKKNDIINKLATDAYGTEEAPYLTEYYAVTVNQKPKYFETYFPPMDKHFAISVAPWGENGFATMFTDITERILNLKKISESEQKYHDLVETAQDMIWQVDQDGKYIYLNPAWENVLGYKPEEMIGKTFTDFQTPEQAENDKHVFSKLLKGNLVKNYETIHIHKNGTPVNLIFNAKFVLDKSKNIIGTRGTAYDITQQKKTQERIKGLLQEKELLLKEVHHRVKNDMYIISNILGLQALASKNTEVVKSLNEARERVNIMFNIYNTLYKGGSFQKIQISEYLEELIMNIKSTYMAYQDINIEYEISGLNIDSRISFPIGIIINELVNNAYKYAFDATNKNGTIKIKVTYNQNSINIIVQDNGKGIDDNYRDNNNETFGFMLINALITQFHGSLKISTDHGTKIDIILNIDKMQEL